MSICCGVSRRLVQTKPMASCILLYFAFSQFMIFFHSSNAASRLVNSSRITLQEPAFSTSAGIECNSIAKSQQPTTVRTIRKYPVGEFPFHPVIPPSQWVEWKPVSDRRIKLPYPIFVTSLPKSGTTSIWKYFLCGDQAASHNWILKRGQEASSLSGVCIEENVALGRPPFENCGNYDIYTDTGYLNYAHDTGERCYYPSIDALQPIYASYPNATFVNVVRDSKYWYSSLRNFSSASLFVRMRLCNATGFPDGQSSAEDFIRFYENHNEMIRKFVRDRPSLTYVEVQLESPETGKILQEQSGIPASCWKKCKPENQQCDTTDDARNIPVKRRDKVQKTQQQQSIAKTPKKNFMQKGMINGVRQKKDKKR